MQCVDPVVPISKVISRMEKHLAAARESLAKTHQRDQRLMLQGACAAYEYEIDALLLLAASTQPIIRDIRK